MTNITSFSSEPSGRPKLSIILKVFVASAIALASVLGNILVIIAVQKDRRLQNITNLLIQNLSITDIGMAVVVMPFWIVSIYHQEWVFSDALCQSQATGVFLLGLASNFTMGLIAINRYLKVVRTRLYGRIFPSKGRTLFYVLLAWILSLLLATPPLYGWGRFHYQKEFEHCSLVWDFQENMSYIIVICACLLNFTTFIMFFCYFRIYRSVKASSTHVRASLAPAAKKPDIRVLKSTFAVLCIFTLCWAPISFACMSHALDMPPPATVTTMLIYLMFTSSCLNPVAYGLLNPRFRAAFPAVLRCRTVNH